MACRPLLLAAVAEQMCPCGCPCNKPLWKWGRLSSRQVAIGSRSDGMPIGDESEARFPEASLGPAECFPRPAVHSALDLVKLGPVVSCEVGPFLPTTSMRTR